MPWAYTTVEQLMDTLTISSKKDKSNPEWLREIIEGVSMEIDRWTERTFRIYEGTLYNTPEFHDLLFVDDILSVTSVKIDNNFDGVYEITMATPQDYRAEPYNAPTRERPYTRLRQSQRTYYFFPQIDKSVQITGKWGYWERLSNTRATLTVDIDTDDDMFTVSNVDLIKRGWTLRVGSEQMYVLSKDPDTTTITVLRGQNGTTATNHTSGDAIKRYVYPEALSTATLLQAARIYRRSETPLGIVNNPGDIGWRAVYVPKLDLDVQQLLAALTKRNSL